MLKLTWLPLIISYLEVKIEGFVW